MSVKRWCGHARQYTFEPCEQCMSEERAASEPNPTPPEVCSHCNSSPCVNSDHRQAKEAPAYRADRGVVADADGKVTEWHRTDAAEVPAHAPKNCPKHGCFECDTDEPEVPAPDEVWILVDKHGNPYDVVRTDEPDAELEDLDEGESIVRYVRAR